MSQDAVTIILASWRDGTKSQYQTHLLKWFAYCKDKSCNILSPPVAVALDFLATLFHSGLSYSSINTARSALSSILQVNNNSLPFGQLPIVQRFMKGIYELRPSFPKYTSVWDLKIVFNYFRSQPSASELTLKHLSLKVTFLLGLLSGQRCQTIHLLRIDHMDESETKYVFPVYNKVKQTRPGKHIKPLEFIMYPNDEKLCVVTHLKEYINRTSQIRNSCKQLLISYIRPHGPVKKSTVSRWCKSILYRVGIDINKFSGHSTRAASSSFLADQNFSIKDIMMSAGWSNEQTFERFYHKPTGNSFNYGQAILTSFDED